MKKLILILMLVCLPSMAANISTDSVLLQALDKTTGRTSFLAVKVGKPYTYGDLVVTAEKCMKHPPEETPENSVFLTVTADEAELFRGWMFSSNPALSAMDHPVYDIWVLECITPNTKPMHKTDIILEESQDPVVDEEDLED